MDLVIPANPAAGFMWDKSFRIVEIDNVKMVSVFDIIRHLVGSDGNQHLFWVNTVKQNPELEAGVRNHQRIGKIIDAKCVVMLLHIIPVR